MEPRITDTNSGDDSRGRAFGLDGNLYLPLVAAVVGSIGLFALLALLFRVPWPVSGPVAGVPLAATLAWALALKHGKPRGYDRDRIEQALGLGDFSRGEATANVARTHDRAPDGRFVNGLLVFGSPERGGLAAKGIWVEPPDLRGASNARLNLHQDQVRALLALLGPGWRMQVQWLCDSDYRPEVRAYDGATRHAGHETVRAARNERVVRYWPRMQQGELRRERLAVFVSREITARAGVLRARTELRHHYENLLGAMTAQFDEFTSAVRGVFGAETRVRPMDDLAHCAFFQKFLNPSLAQRDHFEPAALFDPTRTIQENCWLGEGASRADGGFLLDEFYHTILTLDRWPQRTRPGIVTHLTGLPFIDYAITVLVTPGAAAGEIRREEKAVERIAGEYADGRRHSLLVALRKKERKIENLAGGFVRPFGVTYIIRVWARSPEVLRDRVRAVQQAIHGMDGANYLECTLSTTAKKLFFASWPGWTHSSYVHREHYAEDQYLADLLPFSATFTGALETAEALYDGSNGNVVGVSTVANGSPQHAVVFGMTGTGKSAFVENLLLQTDPCFEHTLLVEEGFSYKHFTEKLGETPIVVHPDAPLTLNYLDTQGLPLTQLHLASAVALLSRMVGVPDSAEQLALRQAQLSQYLQQLYRDVFVDWARRRPERAEEIRRLACAVHRWREEKMPAGATPLEAFCDLRDRRAAGEDEARAFVARLPEEDVTRFAQDSTTERFVTQTACAFLSPEEFPTHGALVELLAYARLPEHPKDEIDRIATLLRAWSVDGQYGKLFDGVTNVSLRRKIVHFELGFIPEQAVEMKAAAGLLISGFARQHILALPRSARKRVVFEEVARFLDIPGGEQIVAESYAQLRKFNCWAVSIVQQYARFKASRVRSAVIGNAKLFFLMRQTDRAELADLAADLALPESAIDAIQQYPLPEQLSAEKRYSSVCYFAPTAQPPQCGTIRHILTPPNSHAA